MPPERLPSALAEIHEIAARLGQAPAIFLDYDGTLTPLVPDPKAARIGSEERSVLRSLSRKMPVAIVSGRDLGELARLVSVEGLIYSGNHGWEIEGPGIKRFRQRLDERTQRSLEQAFAALERAMPDFPGVFLERKRFSIAVHTRSACSDAVREAAVAEAAKAGALDGLRLTSGKEIAELRPTVLWDKGRAVEYVLDSLAPKPIPLYIGDDRTDEDAFGVVAHRWGVGVVVGCPANTGAAFSVADPREVFALLRGLDSGGTRRLR
ncbi:MAG TPA: trehalose-phosphatase [Acidimicrobiia bacterium]|nr:trehalose-phosphatase [Acidimicrobiia bacterium]